MAGETTIGLTSAALTAIIEKFPVNEKEHIFWANIPKKTPLVAKTAYWDVIEYGRDKANPVMRGEWESMETMSRETKTAPWVYLSRVKALDVKMWDELRRLGRLDSAETKATFAAAELKDLHGYIIRGWESLIAGMLGTGTLSYPSGETIDFGVNTGDASASWYTASTDIIGDIADVKATIEQNSGLSPAYMIMNSTTKQGLLKNTTIQNLAKYQFGGKLLSGSLPPIEGLQVVVYDKGYVDSSGSFNKYIPDDTVIFVPEWNSDWWGWIPGPIDDDDAEGVTGFFATEKIITDAKSKTILVEHSVGLPVLFRPKAVYVLDVTP